jgi:hypothetical protein
VHSWADHVAIYGGSERKAADAALQAVLARLLDRYYHAREKIVEPPILLNGNDLMSSLQIAPGKRVGELLDAVREAQATGEITTREGALEFVRRQNAGRGEQ